MIVIISYGLMNDYYIHLQSNIVNTIICSIVAAYDTSVVMVLGCVGDGPAAAVGVRYRAGGAIHSACSTLVVLINAKSIINGPI